MKGIASVILITLCSLTPLLAQSTNIIGYAGSEYIDGEVWYPVVQRDYRGYTVIRPDGSLLLLHAGACKFLTPEQYQDHLAKQRIQAGERERKLAVLREEQRKADEKEKAFVAEQQAKGLVLYEGIWTNKETASRLEAEKVNFEQQNILGAFGIVLGTRVNTADYHVNGFTLGGKPTYGFIPSHPIKDLSDYSFAVTPKTSLITTIYGTSVEMVDGLCTEPLNVIVDFLKQKYGDVQEPRWFSPWTVKRKNRNITVDIGHGLKGCYVQLIYSDEALQAQAEDEWKSLEVEGRQQEQQQDRQYLQERERTTDGSGL